MTPTVLPPERRFVLALSRLAMNSRAAAAAAAAAAEGLSASRVLADGASHGVLPLIDRQIGRLGLAAGLPPEVVAGARKAACASALRTATLLSAAARATRALAGAGMAPLVLKGAHLARTLYPEPGLRPMSDVDLLVARQEMPRAVEALSTIGFAPAATLGSLDYYLAEHFHLPLHDPSGKLCLELHFDLIDRYSARELDGRVLAASSRPLDAADPGLGRVLEPTANLLYLALHAVKHAPLTPLLVGRADFAALAFARATACRLVWYVDLAELAARGDIDWERLRATASAAGVEELVGASLAASAALLGPEAFAGAEALVRPRRVPHWRQGLAAMLIRRLDQDQGLTGRIAERLLRMDPVSQIRPLRLLTAVAEIFPSLDSLAARRARGRRDAVFHYPGHVLTTTARGLVSAVRHVLARHRAPVGTS